MKSEVLCTILVITYNHEKYLGRALDSILSQKTKYRYKISIFDDASNDDTKSVINQYTKNNAEVITAYIAEKNQGAQTNIWNAFKSIDTKYFMVLEGDDYWCDDRKLELQISALEKNPECSFCGHNTYLVSLDETSREYNEGALCCTQDMLRVKNVFDYKDFINVTSGGYIPYVSARLIRSNAIDLNQIKFKESILFDFTQFYYLLLKGSYYYIDMPMSVYQRTGTGVCSGKSPTEFLNDFLQNSIDFNKETNNIIADKIYSDCLLQIDFRLKLYKSNYIRRPIKDIIYSTSIEKVMNPVRQNSIIVQENKFSNEKYYYLCNGGLGHTAIICALKSIIESQIGAEICLLLKEEHSFIASLYKIDNYIQVNIEGLDIEAISDRYPNPEKGKIYVTHPFSHREARSFYEPVYKLYASEKYVPWLCEFLGISKESDIIYPVKVPEVTEDSRKKISQLGDLNRLVLFLPEADSISGVTERFWENKAKELKKEGYKVISCPRTREYAIWGTEYKAFSAEEIVYIGMRCHSIYALRNGFCDLLAKRGKALHIVYSSHNAHYIYSLNKPGSEAWVNEEIILQPSRNAFKTNVLGNTRVMPMLFGCIRLPDGIYNFYNRHRYWFKNKKLIKALVKWI